MANSRQSGNPSACIPSLATATLPAPSLTDRAGMRILPSRCAAPPFQQCWAQTLHGPPGSSLRGARRQHGFQHFRLPADSFPLRTAGLPGDRLRFAQSKRPAAKCMHLGRLSLRSPLPESIHSEANRTDFELQPERRDRRQQPRRALEKSFRLPNTPSG